MNLQALKTASCASRPTPLLTPLLTLLLALTPLAVTPVAMAQTAAGHDPAQPAAPQAAPAAGALPWADAEVRRVDGAAGKLSLRHGEIKNLDMPPMTMVFQVRDPALLERVKPGDKVRFRADKINGAYTVLEIVPAP